MGCGIHKAINRPGLIKKVIDSVSYHMTEYHSSEVKRVNILKDRFCDRYILVYKKQGKGVVFVEYVFYMENYSAKTTEYITIPIDITDDARDTIIIRFIDSILRTGHVECAGYSDLVKCKKEKKVDMSVVDCKKLNLELLKENIIDGVRTISDKNGTLSMSIGEGNIVSFYIEVSRNPEKDPTSVKLKYRMEFRKRKDLEDFKTQLWMFPQSVAISDNGNVIELEKVDKFIKDIIEYSNLIQSDFMKYWHLAKYVDD